MSDREGFHYKKSENSGLWVVYLDDVVMNKFIKEEIAKTDVALANECILEVPISAEKQRKFDLWGEVRRILVKRKRGAVV